MLPSELRDEDEQDLLDLLAEFELQAEELKKKRPTAMGGGEHTVTERII